MRDKHGIEVEAVRPGSPAERAGLVAGDIISSINGYGVSDVIDYMYMRCEPELDLSVRRGSKGLSIKVSPEEGEDPGVELRQFRIKTCRNNCVFCFVAQLPKGLRKTLYLKDEDYRMSFLYGNYITMTNLTEEDRRRIVGQRLSPLYISVHSTDRDLRNRLLGNPKAADIMAELEFLKENRIAMHVQIVLCPGMNDGAELKKTLRDLCTLYPHLHSAAVVPVGLTAHRKLKLAPVGKEDAEKAIDMVEGFQRRFRKKHGDPIVYAGDELYIKAGRPFPALREYGDLPQIENGVGMVPRFLSQARKIKLGAEKDVLRAGDPETGFSAGIKLPLRKKYITFTGVSFHPFLKKYLERLSKNGVQVSLVPVENNFFGRSVTVAGLLTGRDVVRALLDKTPRAVGALPPGGDVLLIPDVVLREGKDIFLDDIKTGDLGEALGLSTKVIEPTPAGLLKAIAEEETNN